MMSSDVYAISSIYKTIAQLILTIIQVIVIVGILYYFIEYITFVCFIIYLFLVPFYTILILILFKVTDQMYKFKDKRIKKLTEVILGIKIIKFFAWFFF
jgi:ABC-type multidrug transport system fused ATPase/permease subunit